MSDAKKQLISTFLWIAVVAIYSIPLMIYGQPIDLLLTAAGFALGGLLSQLYLEPDIFDLSPLKKMRSTMLKDNVDCGESGSFSDPMALVVIPVILLFFYEIILLFQEIYIKHFGHIDLQKVILAMCY